MFAALEDQLIFQKANSVVMLIVIQRLVVMDAIRYQVFLFINDT